MSARKPLFEEVSDRLSDMILVEGKFAPGEKLPNEMELAQLFNVGRTTVREAIKPLVLRGLVRIDRGNGTFVADHPGAKEEDPLGLRLLEDERRFLLDWYETRRVVEGGFVRLAAENRTEEDLRQLREILARQTERTSRLDPAYIWVDQEFHCALAAATHNSVIQKLQPALLQQGYFRLVGKLAQVNTPRLTENADTFHEEILRCLERRDGPAACAALEAHMLRGREDLEALTAED